MFKKISIVLVIALCLSSCAKDKEPENKRLIGEVFGTTYGIQFYNGDVKDNYSKQIDSLFEVVNQSMSTYRPSSNISKVNRNETFFVDDHFKKVFTKAKEVYRFTEGAFDPTIGNLVNAWSFGPEEEVSNLDSLKIKNMMRAVGFNRVGFRNDSLLKPEASFIDFNAIAKGYGVDVIADYLETQGVGNYIVEIGGEIRCKGINIEKDNPWQIGVETPDFSEAQTVMKTITLKDESMATSGTYRKFKVNADGSRYSHIINTKTGYPSQTNVLSISVIAEDCMTADAYATALETMSIERLDTFLDKHQELKVFLIYENQDKVLETKSYNGFPQE